MKKLILAVLLSLALVSPAKANQQPPMPRNPEGWINDLITPIVSQWRRTNELLERSQRQLETFSDKVADKVSSTTISLSAVSGFFGGVLFTWFTFTMFAYKEGVRSNAYRQGSGFPYGYDPNSI
jgi:predicted PurR-regulated permease PerM